MNAPACSLAAAAPTPTISIRNYAIVTAAYWAFTLTDDALRMLVLLHSTSSSTRRCSCRFYSCCTSSSGSSRTS